MNLTAPHRPIQVSDDHVSSADETRKNYSPDHWLKCNLCINNTTCNNTLVIIHGLYPKIIRDVPDVKEDPK